MLNSILYYFFFKQKTAYEMRISDWSSDVCSSDLSGQRPAMDHRSGVLRAVAGSDGHAGAALGLDAEAAWLDPGRRRRRLRRQCVRGAGARAVDSLHGRHLAGDHRRVLDDRLPAGARHENRTGIAPRWRVMLQLRHVQRALGWCLVGLLLTYVLINAIGLVSPFWGLWRHPGDPGASSSLLNAWQSITPWFDRKRTRLNSRHQCESRM